MVSLNLVKMNNQTFTTRSQSLKQIIYLLIKQMMIGTGIVCLTWLINSQTALAVLVAVMIHFITNLYFIIACYTKMNPCYARQVVNNVYKSEIIKLSLTIIMMLLAIHNLNLNILPLFMTYVLLQISNFLLLSFDHHRRHEP